jgi:hypothetical protein
VDFALSNLTLSRVAFEWVLARSGQPICRKQQKAN